MWKVGWQDAIKLKFAMKTRTALRTAGLASAIAGCLAASLVAGPSANFFPSYADGHTVALWLFDENQYPHTTLTDASENEYDLCLMEGGKLVPGKFGHALQISTNTEMAVGYAGFRGAIPEHHMRAKDGTPSGLWGPTVAPAKLLTAFSHNNWTIELWLRLASPPSGRIVLLDLGQGYDGSVTLALTPAEKGWVVENAYAGFRTVCPTRFEVVTNGQWHHIAFTCSPVSGKISHFLDGVLQGAPKVSASKKTEPPPVIEPDDLENDTYGFTAEKDEEWRRQNRFNFSIGHDRRGDGRMNGIVDELRISDTVRYTANFPPPGSFSRNYNSSAPKPAGADGPKLLFGPDSPQGPVQLGSRKYLFIDDALIDKEQNVELTCNPASGKEDLNFRPAKSSWRPTVFDKDGEVCMFIPDGYSSKEGISRLLISDDGLNFHAPKLGLISCNGSKENNFIFYREPMYGVVFQDLNPNVLPEEQYKLTAWVANRGIYVYVSPEGIHWRRNETCMLPLVSGGDAETYWDDQRGVYMSFLKRDSSFKTKEFPGGGRRACMFESSEILKAWPFNALANPYFEAWPMPAVTGEGPVVFSPDKNGEVYRTRAIKYPWAPDTYLAFVWRFGEGERRQIDLGVSRDGIHWKFWADKVWYVNSGDAEEVLSIYGLIRRGDELWQYADYGSAHGGDKQRTYARLKQRLDGFVSLDAIGTGLATTRPLVFQGSKLVLNVAARGGLKVAILDESGQEIKGFGLAECDLMRLDGTHCVASWKSKTDVGKLAGKVVRLKFEMQDAKLYAMQFQ